MKNRVYGILLILLSLVSIYILVFLFPCNNPNCTEPECKDITGAIFPMFLGIPIVIDSLIHKNKEGDRKYGAVHLSKAASAQTIRNFAYRETAISHEGSKNRNCS